MKIFLPNFWLIVFYNYSRSQPSFKVTDYNINQGVLILGRFNKGFSEHIAHKHSYNIHSKYQYGMRSGYHKAFMNHHYNMFNTVFPGPTPSYYYNPFP